MCIDAVKLLTHLLSRRLARRYPMAFGLCTDKNGALEEAIGQMQGSWGWWTDGSLRAHGQVFVPSTVRDLLQSIGPQTLMLYTTSMSQPLRLLGFRVCRNPLYNLSLSALQLRRLSRVNDSCVEAAHLLRRLRRLLTDPNSFL